MKQNSNLYYFNPTCEYAVGNGSPNWQPNQLLRRMETDLDILPMFFASSNDFVLVGHLPSKTHLEKLGRLGIEIPGFIQERDAFTNINIQTREWKGLKPWGWSPAAHKLLHPFKNNCSEDFKDLPVSNWNPGYRELYSKKFSLGILTRMLDEFPHNNFIPKDFKAVVCANREEVETLISKWGKVMVKAPWSSSGRGLQPITKTPVHPKVWEKLLAIIKDQGYVMVEPLLDKKLDIAFQFKAGKQRISFVGISNFTADPKGRYIGNNLNGLPDDMDPELVEFAEFVPQIVVGPLIRVLETSEIAHSYDGFFGVDALIYEDENGNLKINPCLEINLRYNMGLLSVLLESYLLPGKKGIYRTWFEPGRMYLDFKNQMEERHPVRLNGQRLESGFLSLTDPGAESRFGAYILI